MVVELVATNQFKKNVRQLVKHYPNAETDLDALFIKLEQGQTPGDRISGVGYTVYKVRVKSSDINRGANAAFRVIYYIKTKDCVFLIAAYPKPDQKDIEKKALKRLIDNEVRGIDLPC